MNDDTVRCSVCGETINLHHGNYRIVGIRVDPVWREPDKKGAPPQSVYKHKHCMDADEWKTDEPEVLAE